MKTRVLIIDGHPIFRHGLAVLINWERDLEVCGEAEDMPQAMEAIRRLKPDVVILDVNLKHGSGIELIKEIKLACPPLPILVLSLHDQSLFAERAFKAGAQGYIMKQEAGAAVIAALRRILCGDIYLGEDPVSKVSGQFSSGAKEPKRVPINSLGGRELEIFKMLGQGRRTRQIASDLRLSEKTIEAYRKNLKRKLSIKERAGLMRFAVQWAEAEHTF